MAIQQKLLAPELAVSQWFNIDKKLTLESLRGRPVLLHTFQMLCPGCVIHAIPLIQKAEEVFRESDLVILGLHTVFEHHEAMEPVSLEAFLHEYRIGYPVGVDQAGSAGPVPKTMETYKLRGTPSTLLINRKGELTASMFGQVDEMALGAMVQSLIADTEDHTK